MLMDMLQQRGADVAYHDPYVPVIKPTREHAHFAGTRSVNWDRSTIQAFDLVLIATNHANMNIRTFRVGELHRGYAQRHDRNRNEAWPGLESVRRATAKDGVSPVPNSHPSYTFTSTRLPPAAADA